jgi:hypothetical protein
MDAGARVVMLRRGAEGSLVCERGGSVWAVPALEGVPALDPTGCGNAYCGGFLAAWAAGESAREAVWSQPVGSELKHLPRGFNRFCPTQVSAWRTPRHGAPCAPASCWRRTGCHRRRCEGCWRRREHDSLAPGKRA